jgi:hypothetical protein
MGWVREGIFIAALLGYFVALLEIVVIEHK